MKLLYLVESGESKFLFRGDGACFAWRKATVDEIVEHFKNR